MTKKLIVFIFTAMFTSLVFAGFEVPDDPKDDKGRFIVCHKGKKTLAVEGEESKNDHLGHGDWVGECGSS